MTRRIAVVTAGLRDPSSTRLLADRLAAATAAALQERGVPAQVEVIEVRELGHDLINMMLTGFAAPALQVALDTVAAADGVVAVSPIFSGSYNGLFKLFFDALPDTDLVGTPVLIGATAGTPRHSLALDHALRPLLTYLRAVVVPTGVFAATDDFGAVGASPPDGEAPLSSRVERGARELAELVARAAPKATVDEFADVPSFDQLLGGTA